MATRERTIEIGKELAELHGLTGWTITVQGHSTDPCLGKCDYSKKKVSIETYAADLMSEDEIKGTWLHEIAHALVGPDHDHDAVWQARCSTIGGIASPSYSPEQLKTVFMDCRKMMTEIIGLDRDAMAKVANVYSPIATARNAINADHALRLVLAGYKVLTEAEKSNAAVADSLGLPTGSIAAVKAWNTMWKGTLSEGASHGK